MNFRRTLAGAAALATLTVLVPTQAAQASTPDTLREAARGTGIRIGTAVDMSALAEDAPYREAIEASSPRSPRRT